MNKVIITIVLSTISIIGYFHYQNVKQEKKEKRKLELEQSHRLYRSKMELAKWQLKLAEQTQREIEDKKYNDYLEKIDKELETKYGYEEMMEDLDKQLKE